MFGKNRKIKQDLTRDHLLVKEVFATIQGEGPFAGTPCVFVRLAGCNLACWFCDTDFENGDPKTVNDLIEEVMLQVSQDNYQVDNLVVITGGEPFAQPLGDLIYALNSKGFRVQVETAGTLWDPVIPRLFSRYGDPNRIGIVYNTIVCSPKTGKINKNLEEFVHAWKYIIQAGETASEDGLPVASTQARGQEVLLARPPAAVLKRDVFVQPCDEYDVDKNRANLTAARDISLRYGYRLCVQVHKLEGVSLP